MKDVPDEQRQAAFHCVLVYLRHADDPTPIVCYGRWSGYIARQPAGEGGFGYDPIFFATAQQKSAAQMSKAEKAAVSHRGLALQQLMEALRHG